MKKSKFSGTLLLLPMLLFFFSCRNEDKSSPFANFHPEKEIGKYIDGYYSSSLGEASNPKSGNPAVYIDFSDGLVQAYTKTPQNVQIIQAITNKLVSPSVEWYSMGDGKISKLEYNSNELFNKVSDSKQYKTIMAPIQETLKKITEGNNDALMVTDYEEYTPDGKEQIENYPKTYFINWLKKGNSITLFYTDYEEVNAKTKVKSPKHLYFTVFTQGRVTENSMVSMIRDAFKGRITTKEFNINNNPYSVSNDYGGKEMTGLQNKAYSKYVNLNNNACADRKLPYEVIGINKPWDEKLDEFVKKNIIEKEAGVFMGKLLLNAADQSSYKLNKIAVKVYDVSADYKRYAQCEEAKIHAPQLTKDKGKNDVWADQSAKDPVIAACYEKNTTRLKNEWVYAPSKDKPGEEWAEVFSNDEKIFSDHMKNSPDKVELITTFHKNYKVKNIKKADALWRIDYIVEDATFNDANPQLADFSWPSTTEKGKTNTSLSEAVRNTLQDESVRPKGKILYTYYIKTGNSGKTE
jgi:hypothetical protein